MPYLRCLTQRFVADSRFIEACIRMQGNTVPVKHMSSTNQHTNLSKCRYYTPKCAQITCPLFDMVIKESNQYVVKGSTFVYSSNKTFLKFIEQLSISLSAMLPCFYFRIRSAFAEVLRWFFAPNFLTLTNQRCLHISRRYGPRSLIGSDCKYMQSPPLASRPFEFWTLRRQSISRRLKYMKVKVSRCLLINKMHFFLKIKWIYP